MKNYTYETLTGPVTIEVDEYWHKLLLEADEEEENNDRAHTRSDHKYAPGAPVSLESLEYESKSLADPNNYIAAVELAVDLNNALKTLTPLQERYYILHHLQDIPCAEIARREGKSTVAIFKLVRKAERKVKKYFE